MKLMFLGTEGKDPPYCHGESKVNLIMAHAAGEYITVDRVRHHVSVLRGLRQRSNTVAQ